MPDFPQIVRASTNHSLMDINPMIVVVLLLAILAFAAFTLRECWRVFALVRRSGSWPMVVGRIISSEISESSGGEGTSYEVKLEYEYSVGGRVYRNNRFGWMGVETAFKGRAKRILATYPVGGLATVYYEPSDPSQAVLESHRLGVLLIRAAAALIAILVIIGMIGGWIRI